MTKKEAAFNQINGAIKLFEEQDYACAITLAAAAEGQLSPSEDSQHLFEELRVRVPPEFKNEKEWADWLNATAHWLKHPTPQHGDEWEIDEFIAAIMLLRAISKFSWTYKQRTERMTKFWEHWMPSISKEQRRH